MPSYEQSKNGKSWSVRFREKVDGKTVNKRLSGYTTEDEAQQAYNDYMDKSQSPQNTLTFDQLVTSYLSYLKSRVKESSFYDTERRIKNRICPFFKDMLVTSIKPLDVLNWQQSLNGYSFKYKRSLQGHLSCILRFADRYYDIPSIVHKVEPLRNTEAPKEMLFWTEEEFEKFITCVPMNKPAHKMYFVTLYLLGCRKGEALALTWNDIDIDDGVVSISKSITRKVEGRPYAITTPKNTFSNRKISIPRSLCNEFVKYRQSLGEDVEDTSFVFGISHPLTERTTDRIFSKACENAGVKRIRLHDLRHSCASLLISRGVSVVAVSKRLGHKNIEQTLNTYSHMMPEEDIVMQQIVSDLVEKMCTK